MAWRVLAVETYKYLGLGMALIIGAIGGAVWLSGNALASINVVALRQTRLVPG